MYLTNSVEVLHLPISFDQKKSELGSEAVRLHTPLGNEVVLGYTNHSRLCTKSSFNDGMT